MNVKDLINFLSCYPDSTKIKIKNHCKLNNVISMKEYWNLSTNTIELVLI